MNTKVLLFILCILNVRLVYPSDVTIVRTNRLKIYIVGNTHFSPFNHQETHNLFSRIPFSARDRLDNISKINEIFEKNENVTKRAYEIIHKIKRIMKKEKTIGFLGIEANQSHALWLQQVASQEFKEYQYALLNKGFNEQDVDNAFLLMWGPVLYLHAKGKLPNSIKIVGVEHEETRDKRGSVGNKLHQTYSSLMEYIKHKMDRNAEGLETLHKISRLTELRSKIDDGYVASQEEINHLLEQLPNKELKQLGSDLIAYTIKENELNQKREEKIANNALQLKLNGIVVIGSNHVRNIKRYMKKKR